MKKAANNNTEWYHQRPWAAVISVLSFISCYIVVSLAIDSGSLIQYFCAIVLLVAGINRLAHIVIVSFSKAKAA